MHSHDFIADQTLKTNARQASPSVATHQHVRRLLRALWSGVRQVAWGIDAYSRVRHGIEVPPDHGARNRPSSPRPGWDG